MEANGVDRIPFIWFWPNGANACVTITHDVETEMGRAFCVELMGLNDSFGIKSSFQIVPESRYLVPESFLNEIRARGFEVAVHDLNHDGRLYDEEKEFQRRVKKINEYARHWGAKGFRAGVLYRNPAWFEALDFSYEMSIPNVAHMDPQPGGCCTIFPYFIGDMVEIPVTTIQDYTLFNIVQELSIDLWSVQLDIIIKRHGMASFIVHPDYIIQRENWSVYEQLLSHLRKLRSQNSLWFALPKEIDSWWRLRHQLELTQEGNGWRIQGEGSERAALAFATRVDGKLKYELEACALPV
jgi:hypothetical protein